MIEQMVAAGVDLMELQIPFSEPMADGPVILKANQKALERGAPWQNAWHSPETWRPGTPFLFCS